MERRHVLTDDIKMCAVSAEVVHSAFTISRDLLVVSAEVVHSAFTIRRDLIVVSAEVVVHSAFTIRRDQIVVSAALTFGVILTTNIIAKNAERDGCAVRSDYCRL